MDCWGYKLFQSDHDHDLITCLNKEAGLEELEKAIKGSAYIPAPPEPDEGRIYAADQGRTRFVGRNASFRMAGDLKLGTSRMHYSMYGPFCSDVDTVGSHLDTGGVLEKMLAESEKKMLAGETSSPVACSAGPGYEFVFLGACAVTFGCAIPEHYKSVMRQVYMEVGLMHEAITQINEVLDGPKPYQDGKPYDFGSLDLSAAMNQADLTNEPNPVNGIVGMNCPGPGEMCYTPPQSTTGGLRELRENFAESRYGRDVCSVCGMVEDKDSSALLMCGGCHRRKCCSKKCQKQHWKVAHKNFCTKGPSDE